MITVAVFVACRNRFDRTKVWLNSLEKEVPGNWDLSIYAVDDGSTDLTFETLVNARFWIDVTRGPGDWFWAKSMSVAENKAFSASGFDYFLWANDDTEYLDGALKYIEQLRSKESSSIIVGKFVDPRDGRITYGGLRKLGKNPFKYQILDENIEVSVCDSFHGNFVLIPTPAAKKIGRIDGEYQHAYADYDYANRAKKLGIRIISPRSPIGTCLENKWDFGDIDKLSVRLKFAFSRKGLPIKSQVRFLRKFGPFFWIRFLIQPYIRAVLGKNANAHISLF